MLSVARRQKGLGDGQVPPLCVLDPDGDLVHFVRTRRGAGLSAHWACYHTQMWEWREGDRRYGVVGCAVGASFAVLVAEQLFVSGCELLVSISSAGQIADVRPPPYYVLIDRSLRDEGTSYHYLPAAAYVEGGHRPGRARRTGVRRLRCRGAAGAPPGRPTRPFAKRRRRWPGARRKVCSPWRWRRQHSTPSPRPARVPSSAWRTSPTSSASERPTSRRARIMVRP